MPHQVFKQSGYNFFTRDPIKNMQMQKDGKKSVPGKYEPKENLCCIINVG